MGGKEGESERGRGEKGGMKGEILTLTRNNGD